MSRLRSAIFVQVPDSVPGGPLGIARAIATSPFWDRLQSRVQLVSRDGDQPLLGIFGTFDQTDYRAVVRQASVLEDSLPRLKYIDGDRVTALCDRLAQRLVDSLGADVVSRSSFRPIPRGGTFVLGTLAYVLNLHPAQLESGVSGEHQIVVDDCALTGSRIRSALQESPGRPLVFAHLHSNPGLRRHILNREPGIAAMVAASDLRLSDEHTRTPETVDRGNGEMRGYWYANYTDRLIYPWSEPEVGLYDDDAGTYEAAWSVGAPELCLRNRFRDRRITVATVPSSTSKEFFLPDDVLYTHLDEEVIVGRRGDDRAIALGGIAAEIWDLCLDEPTEASTLATLQSRYPNAAHLGSDTRDTIGALISRGLLGRRA